MAAETKSKKQQEEEQHITEYLEQDLKMVEELLWKHSSSASSSTEAVVMSEPFDRRSSVSSISLVEIKAETHLVLQAFLHQTLSIPLRERPGRVGGAYRDLNTYSTKPQPRAKDGCDSRAEDISSADEKKSSLKHFIKQLPHRSKARQPAKDPGSSLDRDIKPKVSNLRDLTEDDVISPSSASDEDDGEKKHRKLDRKMIRKSISKFFRRKMEKEKEERDGQDSHPHRPPILPIDPQPLPIILPPNHTPEFYSEVAERLDKIAQRSNSIKKPIPKAQPPPACDKESVVRELVQVLSLEGDAINAKIQSDPFLRSSLARLSYPSFAKLLDTFSNCQVSESAAPPPAASPTLQRMAVTFEVSRRIVTATGTQRMQGYAECYMETFAPWVKRQGGWEKIVLLEEPLEYD